MTENDTVNDIFFEIGKEIYINGIIQTVNEKYNFYKEKQKEILYEINELSGILDKIKLKIKYRSNRSLSFIQNYFLQINCHYLKEQRKFEKKIKELEVEFLNIKYNISELNIYYQEKCQLYKIPNTFSLV
jgi:hypothetical protein